MWPKCCAAADRIVGPGGDAENLAAEALARALLRWRKLKDLPHRDAWVMRVTINLALDEVRRRRPRSTDIAPQDDVASDATRRVALVAAAATLPKRQREAVALRHLAGLSEAETAAAMGVAVSTVREHTQRGLTALRDRLGPQVEDETHAN